MITLHGYWRSGAAYRVRIALNLKQIAYRQVAHDLRLGEQRDPAFLALQPQGLVPAIEADGQVLMQSPAILEWLEERFPTPALLPAGSLERATVRAMCAIVGCDIHPLNNLRVLQRVRGEIGAADADVTAWIAHWIDTGFAALEGLVARHGRGFAYGSTPSLADAYLVPQVYSARRFGVPLDPYPALRAAADRAGAEPAIAAAAPEAQADADPA